MEIIKQFKERGCFNADLYHFLAKKKVIPNAERLYIVPSSYQKEMNMSTIERIKTLKSFEVDNMVYEGTKAPEVKLLFSPRVIIFQNYTNNVEKLTSKFTVQNIGKASAFMSLHFEESSYFSIKTNGPDMTSRLAPGMVTTFIITFVPARFEDYVHQVTFKADGVTYVLPIMALGPRPQLNLPDTIEFDKTPLKIEKSVNMSIDNTGVTPVSFTLSTRAPFSMEPKSVRCLRPNESVNIKFTFKTMHSGNVQGLAIVELDTGETLGIKLLGSTFTVSLQLERDIVRFDDTYNTMVRQQAFKIINKSDFPLEYMCMKNKNVMNDFEDKLAIVTVWHDFVINESLNSAKLVHYDVLSSKEHTRVYTRIFFDEIQALVAEETLQFQNMHFSMSPIKGFLWPNKVNEITITFHPQEIGDLETTCYLDIDGVADRIPIQIKGISLPPCIVLNVETIDMDRIYINKTYTYELTAINQGHINGVVVYKAVPVLFNSTITCSPEMACLRPLEKQIFTISFTNSNQGPFVEEINFNVRDTQVVLKVYVRGTVIYPTLIFNIPCADFGNVSIGIPKTLEFEIINESETDIVGSVKVNTDGPEINSITLDDCAVNDFSSIQIPKWPKEFKIEPAKIHIGPQSKISLKVTLIPNLIRYNVTTLDIELENSDSPPIVLPVRYNAMSTRITPAPEINLKVCFIDYTYSQNITIECHEYYGYFCVDESEEDHAFCVEVEQKRGLLYPDSTFTLPVKITMKQLGVYSRTIKVYLFGLAEPIEICRITGSCVRPIITVTPLSLQWGQINILTRHNKTLTIINDSPCYVNFKSSVHSVGICTVSPAEGIIKPEEEKDLTVSLCLSDAGIYTNKLLLQFERVKDITVPLGAMGIGTSILVGEHRNRIELDKHFIKMPMSVTIPIRNCGTRFHMLEWCNVLKLSKTTVPNPPFFNLEPRSFKLGARETVEMTISAESCKAVTFTEMWYLVGCIEGINKKEVLMECPVQCEFVEQKLEVSPNTMTFISNTGPYSEYYILTDILTLTNKSKLPLDIDIKIKPPFLIIQKLDTYKIKTEEEKACCCIYYDENDLNTKNIRHSSGIHLPQVYIDYLTNKPVKPLRQGSLHFFEDIHKIKAAFNTTQSIEETLEPEDVMKIQILFDTTKHNSLRSRIYSDTLKIKFRGLKSKNTVKVVGQINFPNLLVMTPRIDFKCVQNGTLGSECIRMQNISNLLVCYRFRWVNFCVTNMSPVKTDTETQTTEFTQTTIEQTILTEDTEIASSDPEMTARNESNVYLEEAEIYEEKPKASETEVKSIAAFLEEPGVLKTKTLNKLIPMIDYENQNRDKIWIEKFPPLVKCNSTNINDLFHLTPSRKTLKPNDIELVHVIFKPKYNISVRAILECQVLGGPSEFLTIHGMSSDLVYRLSTKRLNFGIRPFFENATEILVVSNIALLDFKFEIYLNEPEMSTELEAIIIDTIPCESIVAAEEAVNIEVKVRPGVLGFFNRRFVLEIGYTPQLTIDIVGWGVIPQVYICLPRQGSSEFSIRCIRLMDFTSSYRALSTLTDEFLEMVNEMFAKWNENDISKTSTRSSRADAVLDRRILDDTWHVCSAEDTLPTEMDIEMAIERESVIKHFKRYPNLVKEYRHGIRKGPIPDLRTFVYEIDFGVVINGSLVHCTVDIINYGPIPSKLHLAKQSAIPRWLGLKLCGKLNPGCQGQIEITFAPTPEFFPNMEQSVETEFCVEIPYGLMIPIKIHALCAVPYLKSSVNFVDFGEVKCGEKVIKFIPLSNVGKPTCIWYAVLKVFSNGTNSLALMDSSGKFNPGEGGWLRIAFKPTMEMKYEAVVIFKFHMNPFHMTIPVTGQGLMPQVHIIGPNINFPPTLPYANATEIYFGITNPCNFPIELIVCHCDKKFQEEMELFSFLYSYYNQPSEMLVSSLKPGDPWPRFISEAYEKFKSEVKRLQNDDVSKPTKWSKKVPLKRQVPPPEIRKAISEGEIVSVATDRLNKEGIDPLKESCIDQKYFVDVGATTLNIPRGLIVVFHGSPNEENQSIELACALGKALRLPVINIDKIMVEALCYCETPERDAIRGIIDDFYENMFNIITSNLTEEQMNFAIEGDDMDSFEAVQAKLHFYLSNQGAATPRSKGTDKKTGTTSAGKSSNTIVFGTELIETLLTDYLNRKRFELGFIVESLTSNVICSHSLAVTTILKCKSSIKNIHMILCEASINMWLQNMEEKLQKQQEAEPVDFFYTEDEIKEIVEMCDEMDADEYEQAPEDYKAIYAYYGLESRRQIFYQKVKKISVKTSFRKLPGVNTASHAIDETKSKKDKSSKKEEVKGVKASPEYTIMLNKYNEYYKNTHESLVSVAVNWDFEVLDVGTPIMTLTGQTLGGGGHRLGTKKSTVDKVHKKDIKQPEQPTEDEHHDRGFPLTIIKCNCLKFKKALIHMFKTSPTVKSALRKKSIVNIRTYPSRTENYTVLLPKTLPELVEEECLEWEFLDENPIKKCECNQYNDLSCIDDSTPEAIINVMSKWHCTCGKKQTNSQASTTEMVLSSFRDKNSTSDKSSEEVLYYDQPAPLTTVPGKKECIGRIILEPGDLLRCKYLYHPTAEGKFSLKRYCEVSGWPDSRVEINVTAICDLPRIDRRSKKIFANFTRRTQEDKVYKTTFLDDRGIFEFGPIFMGAQRVHEEVYMIDLKNCSLLSVDMEAEFEEETDVFRVDKKILTIEPGCTNKLGIAAAPMSVGVHTGTLLLCIKDNPEIVVIKISCSGVLPALELLPENKLIDYGSHLLYRRATDRFIIKNNSILPVMWKINNPEDIVENFLVAEYSGVIPRYDNKVVPLTYMACSVGVITNKMLKIDVYDEHGRGEPLFSDSVFLSAECYDVTVICAFEDPSDNSLNFGNVKVNSSAYTEMYFFNRGKYNVYYKLKKMKKYPDQRLIKTIECSNEYGLIPATTKPVGIGFQCTPMAAGKIINAPAYTCTIVDDTKDHVVVAKFPVCISIVSYYNTFTVHPIGELNFHIIPVGSSVIKQVILTNTSVGPFIYDIIVPPQYQRQTLPTSGKEGKLKLPPIPCGCFLIINEDNLLLAGSARIISVQFTATAAQTFEETIQFVVSDTSPEVAQGVPLRLVGTGFAPKLDFWNIDKTFKEHFIVKNVADYTVTEAFPHCVFAENSVTLHFFCVTVGSKHTAPIHLYNDGLVPCIVSMYIHRQKNTESDIFLLDSYNTQIDSLLYKKLCITFSPKLLQEYRAVLEIKLKVSATEEETFKLCLIGEGVMPRIQMLQPRVNRLNLGFITFPVTCIGSVSRKQLEFRNISKVNSEVKALISQPPYTDSPIFWLNTTESCNYMNLEENKDQRTTKIRLLLTPGEKTMLDLFYNPVNKGKISCSMKLTIKNNKYESYTVLCEAEAFMEDVILIGLEMLSMDVDLESLMSSERHSSHSSERKKAKSASAPTEPKKKRSKVSPISQKSDTDIPSLKYLLDFGGCELSTMQKRSVIMVNNSEKVYKFLWIEGDKIMVKPSLGYISPGEEKDLEITFFSPEPVSLKQEVYSCALTAISDESLIYQGPMWDNRQTLTQLSFLGDYNIMEKYESRLNDQKIDPATEVRGVLYMHIIWSAVTEFTRYETTLKETVNLSDTFIYKSRTFKFKVDNVGNVPLKISWNFSIDDEYPRRIKRSVEEDKLSDAETPLPPSLVSDETNYNETISNENEPQQQDGTIADAEDHTKESLYSCSMERKSVDTWFEVDLPFKIEPCKECIKPKKSQTFTVIFHPTEPFEFKVRLKSSIDNLDPYDQNISCKITAKSYIPYVHLEIEESDYIDSARRKPLVIVPRHASVLEFNVLGSGCYQKSFNIVNPTMEGYEFFFEQVLNTNIHEDIEMPPVPVHCNKVKGFIGGGTSIPVTFTFAPSAPGVYESHWRFIVTAHNVVMDLLVVGTVREPVVKFVPDRLMIRHALVGFKTSNEVIMKNTENQDLKFSFQGSSLCDETGTTPIVVDPERGVLKALSETPIKIQYTPNLDGALSFKIYYKIENLSKHLTLCVDSLTRLLNPRVTASLLGEEIKIEKCVANNISLKKTASSYERKIIFHVRNEGSATFFYDWQYSCTNVKKFLNVYVEPKNGYVSPGNIVECTLHFILTQVPVRAFPVTLKISDGPKYEILLHADIERPIYHFSRKEFSFGKCFVSAPENTYKRSMGFTNNDSHTIILTLEGQNDYLPNLFVDFKESLISPNVRKKIPIYFRPNEVRQYEFKLKFWVDSLCLEVITIRGEGVPLLFDVREGCQKSFDIGTVRVGSKKVQTVEVMNYSKVPIEASFFFDRISTEADAILGDSGSQATSTCRVPESTLDRNTVKDQPSSVKLMKNYNDAKKEEVAKRDLSNAMNSLKVQPTKVTLLPNRKVALNIQFKPVGMIGSINIVLYGKVLEFIRPLVTIGGTATDMSLRLSNNFLVFGLVRRRAAKVLKKVALKNEGDFPARFTWQILESDEFTITPMHGEIAPRTNILFSVRFHPKVVNPFVKVTAICNIENYVPLELVLYATCLETGIIQSKSIVMECPVRDCVTEFVNIENPTDNSWTTTTEWNKPDVHFETLDVFTVSPNSSINVPVHFKPRTMGTHEAHVLFSPLGDSALYVSIIGHARDPKPTNEIEITVEAKKTHIEWLTAYNITGFPEWYVVASEVIEMKPIPSYYEINQPSTLKLWGEAKGTIAWTFICFEPCEMLIKIVFTNEETKEYQYYTIKAKVTASDILGVLTFNCRAREVEQKDIWVNNILDHDDNFSVVSEKLNAPKSFRIPKKSQSLITLIYAPLVVEDCEEILSITNLSTGTVLYTYKVHVTCTPGKIKELELMTPVGTRIPVKLRVQNRSEFPVEFTPEISYPSIIPDRPYYPLGPFDKGKFLVWFEPIDKGAQNCTVIFNSPVAGQYEFYIKGTGQATVPRGPYDVLPGGTSIRFKNIYNMPTKFKLTLDNPELFYVRQEYEMIDAKSEIDIMVYQTKEYFSDATKTRSPKGIIGVGVLIVETFDPPNPKVHWKFFLQGK